MRTFTLPGNISLAALDVGDADAPPILFIHGFPLDGSMWHHAAHRLAPHHRVLIPDLRGYGQSPPAGDHASIADYADDLADLLDAARVTAPAVLVGLSMGGMIALDFAHRFPDRLRALVLCCTRATPETPEGLERRAAVAREALTLGTANLAATMAAALFHPSAPAELRELWQRRIAATDPRTVAAGARALASRPDARPLLPTLTVPSLVIAGDADTLTPPDVLKSISDAIPGATFRIIPRAGHLPPVEQPDAFSACLAEFLRTLPPCPPPNR